MTQDEIIVMAKESGFEDFDRWCEHYPQETQRWCQRMEAFAKLVAAKEREACAKSLEDSAETAANFQAKVLIEWCATHIQARSQND